MGSRTSFFMPQGISEEDCLPIYTQKARTLNNIHCSTKNGQYPTKACIQDDLPEPDEINWNIISSSISEQAGTPDDVLLWFVELIGPQRTKVLKRDLL